MPRVLIIEGKMFCEKHQEYFKEYKDQTGNPFWICLSCDIEEEKLNGFVKWLNERIETSEKYPDTQEEAFYLRKVKEVIEK